MSRSRASVMIGTATLVIWACSARLFFTEVGRRVLTGGADGTVLAMVAFPDLPVVTSGGTRWLSVSGKYEPDEMKTRRQA